MNHIQDVPKITIGHPCDTCCYLHVTNDPEDEKKVIIECLIMIPPVPNSTSHILNPPKGCPLVEKKRWQQYKSHHEWHV